MATTQELETSSDLAECLPTESWYQWQATGDVWEPSLERAQASYERAQAIGYARALEATTKATHLLKEARRLSELVNQHNSFENIIKATRNLITVHYKRAERPEAVKEWIAQVEEAIESSRFILRLEENWDEEGSLGYDKDTWERATHFVRDITTQYLTNYKVQIDPPKITPGPDGSIDVRWKTQKRTLLINFPADGEKPADFFGSDRGTDTIKGTLDLSSPSPNQWLLMWLMR
jgi:hypothetical protein